MSNIFQRLVKEEQRWLALQEQAVQKQLLEVYSQTFASLQQELERLPVDSYSRRQVSAIERQLAVLLQDSARQQSQILGDGLQRIYTGRLPAEGQAWARLESFMGDPAVAQQFRSFLPVINQRSVKALLQTQDISIKRFSDDLTTKVRANVAGSMLRGDGIQKTVQRLKEVQDLQGHEPRLKLIARMETARANNQAKSDFIEQVNEEFPELQLWQRVRDRVDKSKKTRNHWFSWAVNNTVRNVSQEDYFEVHHAEIARARQEYAAITGKKAYDSGVLFERFAEGRRGKSIPAHFHDRAVLLGWRPEWGNGFADVKYPQGGKGVQLASQGPADEVLKKTEDAARAHEKARSIKIKDTGELNKKARLTREADADLKQALTAPVQGRFEHKTILDPRRDKRLGLTQKIEQGKDIFTRLVGPAMDDIEPRITFMDAQTYLRQHPASGVHTLNAKGGYLRGENLILLGDEANHITVLHELMHWYEDQHPDVLELSKALIEKRVSTVGVTQLEPNKFLAGGFDVQSYSGQFYTSDGSIVMTEVLTTAAEMVYDNTERHLQLMQDKEYWETFVQAVTLKWPS